VHIIVATDPINLKTDLALDEYLLVKNIDSTERLAKRAKIMYAAIPKSTKSISEIQAPKGPPIFRISSLDEKEEKPGSDEL
jgi:hypothetical protein